MNLFIAFDPGLAGGLTILNQDNELLVCEPMPVISNQGKGKMIDIDKIRAIINFQDEKITMAGIEKVHAMPKQGVSSVFTFGCGYGQLLGLLQTLAIPYRLILPHRWQKEMFSDMSKQATKKMSVIASQRLWPNYDFTKSERSTKVHDGMTDSALLCAYVRKTF